MANTDVTWIDVLPSAKGFLPALNAAVVPAAKTAGDQAGRSFGSSFGASSTNAVEAASTKMSAALRKVEDAAGRVRVAETSLEQVRNNSRSTATQIVTAEERLATARRSETAANENLHAATRRVSDAQNQHTQAVRSGSAAMDEGAQRAGFMSRAFGSMQGAAFRAFAAFEGARVAVDFIGGAVGAARDLNETVNKSSVIFGANAGVVDAWAKGAARSVGLSRAAALESAAGFGNMYTQLGFTGQAAADMSIKTVQMAADLGSFNNLPTADVAEMISGAFRGEYDSLQRLIPTISDATVKAEAMKETGKANADSLTAQEKATAVLAIIQRDGNKAMGDFARTSGGLANQQKILAAQWDDSKARLGALLVGPLTGVVSFISTKAMPVFSNFIDQIPNLGGAIKDLDAQGVGEVLDNIFGNTGRLVDPFRTVSDLLFNSVVPAFRGLWGVAVQLAPAIGTGLVTGASLALNVFLAFAPVLQAAAGFLSENQWAVVALVGAYSAWKLATLANNAVLIVQNALMAVSAAGGIGMFIRQLPIVTVVTHAWTAAQWLLNAAMAANPFVLVGIAIAALVAGIILAYQHSETFRAIVDAAFRAVAAAGQWMWDVILKPAFTALLWYWGLLWAAVQWAWNNVYSPVFHAIGDLAVWLWNTVLAPTWAAMQARWAELMSAAAFAWNSILYPAWQAIQAAALFLWNSILVPTWAAMQAGWNALMSAMAFLWNSILFPAWKAIEAAALFLWHSILEVTWAAMQAGWSALLNAMVFIWNTVLHPGWLALQAAAEFLWNGVLRPIWGAMGAGWDALMRGMRSLYDNVLHPMWDILSRGVGSARTAFDAAVAGIRIVWDSLMDITATPINFVLEVVFNRGLFTAWNWLVDHLQLNGNWKAPHWNQLSRGQHFAEGGPIRGQDGAYAGGGKVKGFSPSSTADNLNIRATAGEYMQPVPAVRSYGLPFMESVRRGTYPIELARAYAGGRKLNPTKWSRDPAYAEDLGFAYGGVMQHVAAAGDEITRVFGAMPGGIGGVGQRANVSDHPKGLALDYMVLSNRGLGDRVADYLYQNARRLSLNYEIWLQRIRNPGGGWQGMADRGSPTANHMDHVHASFMAIPGQVGSGGGGASGAAAPVEPPWYVKMWGDITGAFNWFGDSIKSVGEMVNRFGGSDYVQMIKEIPGKAMTAMWDKVKGTLGGLFDSWTAQQSAAVATGNAGAPILGGPAQGQVQAVFNERGWGSGPQWNAASWIIGKESGWNPRAQNPVSSASGLFQFIDGTWAAYRPPAAAGIRHAKDAAVNQQAIAGARYIAARYGDPIGAQRYWQAHGNYAQGGLVSDLFDRGGIWRHGRVGLNLSGGDERVLTAPQDDYFRRFVAATEDMVERGRGRGGPLIGNVYQNPGESTEVFVDRLYHKLRVADRGGVHVGGGGLL